MKGSNPCYGCLNRKVGCHSTCEDWLKHEAKRNEEYKRRAFASNILSNPVIEREKEYRMKKSKAFRGN